MFLGINKVLMPSTAEQHQAVTAATATIMV
jgi:hypothetical protein